MALVKCPECGKENVSDRAEACPECGFGVKAYFEKIKLEQQAQSEHERRLQKVTMPEHPKKEKEWLVLCVIGVFVLFVGFLKGDGFYIVVGFLTIIVFLSIREHNYEVSMKQYDLAVHSFKAYQEDVVAREYRIAAEEAAKIKCPLLWLAQCC